MRQSAHDLDALLDRAQAERETVLGAPSITSMTDSAFRVAAAMVDIMQRLSERAPGHSAAAYELAAFLGTNDRALLDEAMQILREAGLETERRGSQGNESSSPD